MDSVTLPIPADLTFETCEIGPFQDPEEEEETQSVSQEEEGAVDVDAQKSASSAARPA